MNNPTPPNWTAAADILSAAGMHREADILRRGTCYAVTTGEYSDYRINAIYLDKSLADEHVRRILQVRPKYSYAAAEDFVLDAVGEIPPEPSQMWKSKINILTGEIEVCEGEFWGHPEPGERGSASHRDLDYVEWRSPKIEKFAESESYVSQDHANKLAVEKRQEVLRKVGGVGNLESFRMRGFGGSKQVGATGVRIKDMGLVAKT